MESVSAAGAGQRYQLSGPNPALVIAIGKSKSAGSTQYAISVLGAVWLCVRAFDSSPVTQLLPTSSGEKRWRSEGPVAPCCRRLRAQLETFALAQGCSEEILHMTSCTGLVTLSLFHRAPKETEVKMVKR